MSHPGRQVVPSSTVVVPHSGGLMIAGISMGWWKKNGGGHMRHMWSCRAWTYAWRLADFGWICLNCFRKRWKYVQDVQTLRGISSTSFVSIRSIQYSFTWIIVPLFFSKNINEHWAIMSWHCDTNGPTQLMMSSMEPFLCHYCHGYTSHGYENSRGSWCSRWKLWCLLVNWHSCRKSPFWIGKLTVNHVNVHVCSIFTNKIRG